MSPLYWERHPDGPFATLIRIATTYCSPDADEDAYAGLKRLAKRENVEGCGCSRMNSARRCAIQPGYPITSYLSPSSTTTEAPRRSCADSGTTCTATSLSTCHLAMPGDTAPH